MDWITGIQRALDYTEAHLTDEIDYEEAAKQACSSVFHFQRMFSMLCGFPLGEYIRMRRLTLAANELIQTKAKVIEIALKYGYDTPESFSRAFVRFHGITPTEARCGGNVKSFSRLSVKLILSGGTIMDYRIEKKAAFKVICRRKKVTKPEGDTAAADIHDFWRECTEDGTISALCGHMKKEPKLRGVLGICFTDNMEGAEFPYGIGVEYDGGEPVNGGFEVIEIPAHTFAVFPCRGPMPEAFNRTYRQICSEFFPQSSYEYAFGVELEVYPSRNVEDPNYFCEIWVAVKEKK